MEGSGDYQNFYSATQSEKPWANWKVECLLDTAVRDVEGVAGYQGTRFLDKAASSEGGEKKCSGRLPIRYWKCCGTSWA